ncbi:hypothetical protein [Adhaeretor mobilis]|uniref:Uncharacterized protein n=1 Tax=Adhaeretor mobilis TaxID=1930276 RepID=A0A517MRN5_9BACT|nr:hypothetical protein [Adhaeretor mobilis]QDS97543.1 hypothetical protein HG15A2_08060 [Adhaeretor mobilis]
MRSIFIDRESLVGKSLPMILTLLPWLLGVAPFVAYSQAAAGTTQVALFTGFLAGANAGMDNLNATLAASNIPNYDGMVFDWDRKEEAFDWINMATAGRSTLVIVGHSFGGNSTLQLANNFLKDVGIDVDLTIQVDSVENFHGGWNNLLPSNVDVGHNYYQNSTGFFEPQGEDFVQRATNVNAEVLFSDTSITHTSLDNDLRLYDEIELRILDNMNSTSGDFNFDDNVDGLDFLSWQRNPSIGLLSDWEENYGLASPLVVNTATVPEPAIFALALTASSLMLSRRYTA